MYNIFINKKCSDINHFQINLFIKLYFKLLSYLCKNENYSKKIFKIIAKLNNLEFTCHTLKPNIHKKYY